LVLKNPLNEMKITKLNIRKINETSKRNKTSLMLLKIYMKKRAHFYN